MKRASWVVGIGASLMAATMIVLPWGRDQGIYGQAAQELLEGRLPYRDVFVFKPPMTVIVHALSQLLFGAHFVSIRVLDIGWTTATAFLVALITHRATRLPTVAAVAGLLYAAQYTQQGWWETAQTDGWMSLPMGLALVCVLRRELWWSALAGVLLVVAALFKYPALAVLPFVLGLSLLEAERRWVRPAVVIGGMAVSGLVFMGTMLALGAWTPFIEAQTQVVLPYAGGTLTRVPFGVMLSRLWKYNAAVVLPGAVGLVPLIVDLWRRPRDEANRWALVGAGWFLAGLMSGIAQGKGFEYHFLPTEPGGAVLGGVLLGALIRMKLPEWLVIAGAVIPMGLWVATGPMPERVSQLGDLATGDTTLEQLGKGYRTRDLSLSSAFDVARYVREQTDPDRPILVWGYDPMLYVLSDRPMLSRFPYTYPLVVAWGPRDAYREELVVAFDANPPSVVIVGKQDRVPVVFGHGMDSKDTLRRYPKLGKRIQRDYKMVKTGWAYEVWALKNKAGAP